jgi:hypothetical protein
MNYYDKYIKYKNKAKELGLQYGGDIESIKFNNTIGFFESRIADHQIDIDIKLKDLVIEIRESINPIVIYNDIMNRIKTLGEGLNDSIDFDWNRLPKDINKLTKLWTLREYIVSITFETAYRIFTLYQNQDLKIADKFRKIEGIDAEAFILGSMTLLSDIDITIQSPNASMWIAVMEDLWEQTKWFNHSLWKIDLYGDFTMIEEYYIDTRWFEKDVIIKLLEYALISYFRHENSEHFNNSLLMKLIDWYINNNGLLIDSQNIIDIAKNKVEQLKYNSSREMYYQKLSESEKLKKNIVDNLNEQIIDKNAINNLFSKIIISLSEANLYRNENYILPSTVIHVVRCEQAKESGTSCNPIILKSACCSLSSFIYILSAIEQLGYMLHNLNRYENCNLPASKYFGRLVRSIHKASINLNDKRIIETENMNRLLELSDNLAKIKKEHNNLGITDNTCPDMPNLYDLLLNLF